MARSPLTDIRHNVILLTDPAGYHKLGGKNFAQKGQIHTSPDQSGRAGWPTGSGLGRW